MTGSRSKDKGSSFERQVAKILGDAYGVKLRRTPMSGGWAQGYDNAAGDLTCLEGEFPYCVECKKEEGWRLDSLFGDDHKWFDNWWDQLIHECPANKQPLLVFSRNRAPIFVASHWLPLTDARMVFMVGSVTMYVTTMDLFLKESLK